MLKKKGTVRYWTKNIPLESEVDYTPIRCIAVSVEKQSTKRYHNSIGVIMKLNKCARMLLDFLVERMDNKNYVSNNQILKHDFNEILKEAGQKTYGSGTINKAFSELCVVNLLTNIKSKSIYQVDPLFFFNGPEAEREKLIRDKLEFPHRKLLAAVRREYYVKE